MRRRRQAEGLRGRRARELGRLRVVGETASGLGKLGETRIETGPQPKLELQLPSRRSQGLVDARQHSPQARGAVGREELQPLRLLGGAESVERRLERLAPDHAALALVEDPEARIEPGLEGVRLQKSQAEPMDRRDPGAVERASEIVSAELVQPSADPAAQLACSAFGVGDDEERFDVEPAVAHSLHVALDENRCLACPGTGRDEDVPPRRDRRALLLVRPPHVQSLMRA